MSHLSVNQVIIADIVVIGGGAAGIGLVASLLKRDSSLNITLIEPCTEHYYQPAWTLVGRGAFKLSRSVRPMLSVVPSRVRWIRAAVTQILPHNQQLVLDDGLNIIYRNLIVCTGLRLAWEKIEGLKESLGQHGVTSNYSYQHAAYTWELVKRLRVGTAIFTQPGNPIKCAGAPQKALYLSSDYWLQRDVLKHLDVEFNLAGATLFGVAAFIPSLLKYIEKYQTRLVFNSNLVKVDGPSHTAWFDVTSTDGGVTRVMKTFDFLHVVPPQVSPDCVAQSPLADAAGWCEVDAGSLQHVRFPDVFALGDVCSTGNAKTAAAVRKQIVVVAQNLLAWRKNQSLPINYDGYGACPLTVEKGKVVLAEFGYGGKLLPTFPINPLVARRSMWFLKAKLLPWVYWNGMLKGREWLLRESRQG